MRTILEAPREVSGKKLHGKFRKTDIKWNPTVREIKEILLKPGFPPMYLLDGHEGDIKVDPVAYTRNQLQVIPQNERLPFRENDLKSDPLIGKRIEVFWDDYDKWYSGTVTRKNPKNKNSFVVYYDDADTKHGHHIWETLKSKGKVKWRLLED